MSTPGDVVRGWECGTVSIPEDAAIRRWSRVPWVDRLRWLEEADPFPCLVQLPEVHERWLAMRKELL